MITDTSLLAWQPDSPSVARALIAAVGRCAEQRGLSELPPPPPEPDNCCGNECIECVWLGYYQELAYWRDEAVLRWSA